jgi:hypothetical protein
VDLTWRDAVSTLAETVILIIYAAYLSGSLWLISSTWSTAAVVLFIGLGGRVVGAGGHKTPSRELFHRALRVVAVVFGVIALLAGLSAVLVSSAYSLKIFIMSSIIVWASMVLSHI